MKIKQIIKKNMRSWKRGGNVAKLVVRCQQKNQAQKTKPNLQKYRNGKGKNVKNTKVAPRFEPRTWVSPVRYFATGVAIHPLSYGKQK